ncbi:MAG: 50S ribosomal protein L17 [Candidatus Magasanikbacteria bacterium CG10_big_fil_rev_8_21_14_0_10_36_32]|uniref:Large ribosomal subunit protein bL17 n=1 Tax=Candidatus Magasanikbacteria bacterium CG10_big_fil_rev_8_21_14_0_10_36_32 TaxID=1974646 RepID=A0A2M6W7K2_9BACT|nr:MAG: 50S ribosomal protein L17 [Candidatus Magasanikbacteria bacterium CG10_big_fil_rev_8_21_14_0_10_36_32]
MRHLNKKKTLDRNKAGRRALLANLAESLILYEKIKTTKAKAKAVKSVVEKMVTIAKKNTLASRRELIKKLYTKNAVQKLMDVLGPRYAEKKGGYTRMIALKSRIGDGAEESIIEFV